MSKKEKEKKLTPEDFKFFDDYGTVKKFIKRFKPESLQVQYGANNPYVTYLPTIKLLPAWLPEATVRCFMLKPTEYGVTLFVTLW